MNRCRAKVLALTAAAIAFGAGCSENLTPASEPEPGAEFSCLPNLDGAVESREFPVLIGGIGQYTWANNVAVELSPGAESGWEFSQPAPSEASIAIEAISEKWYAGQFPGAQFAIAQRPDRALDGVYSIDEQALWLHGVASPIDEGADGRTALPYTEPVPVIRFPLSNTSQWQALGTIETGELDGLPYVGTDRYQFAALGAGSLGIPGVEFAPAIRLSTAVSIAPAVGGEVVVSRQDSFIFECFGEVVRTVSRSNETDRDYSEADLLVRLAL